MRIKLRGILISLLAASLVTLAGCQLAGTAVPFETIEQAADYGGPTSYPDHEPLVILLTTHEEISQIEAFISQAALEQLDAMDFQQYVVIAVFRGQQASTGFPTSIECISRHEDQATVYAQFWEMGKGGYQVGAMVTSPYHLVKVRRDAGIDQNTTLTLKSRLVVPTPPSPR